MSFDKQHVMGAAELRAREMLLREIRSAGIGEAHALRREAKWAGGDSHTKALEDAAVRAMLAFAALEASFRQEERLRSAIVYALPLVSKDIDDAMKVRRANRDVIEELEGYERTLKAALEPPHAKEQG